MRHRNVKLLGGVVLILAAGMLFWLTRENDPMYQGKPLSKHLESITASGIAFGSVSSSSTVVLPGVEPHWLNTQAREAVDRVGTNGLTILVRMLKAKDGRMKRWVWEKREEYPFLKKVIPMKPPNSGYISNVRALAALRELGPRAAPAIPRIIPLLDDPESAHVGMAALVSIRPERESDILSLTNVLKIKKTSVTGATPSIQHSSAILALSSFGQKARGAIPILLESLRSTNGSVRGSAAIALARAGAPANAVVPLILSDLPQTNRSPLHPSSPPTAAFFAQQQKEMEDWQRWQMDILALAEYGPEARSALLVLSNLQSYPVVNIRAVAIEASAKIRARADLPKQ